MSNFLHDNVFEGDELTVSPPFGDLILDDSDAPLVLISAGIGCTPIIGMLHYLNRTAATRQVTVLHADRSPARHAHRRELRELVDRLPGAALHHWYENLGVRPATGTTLDRDGSTSATSRSLPTPRPISAARCRSWSRCGAPSSSAGLPEASIHYEVFGPDTWLSAA